jgi:flagellin
MISGVSLPLSLITGLNRNIKSTVAALTRLASGSRINSAVDDAAGLAVAGGLQSRITTTSRAMQNAADGSSALAIADGATRSISDMTMRAQELAMQASNGTLSDAQRGALQEEFNGLRQEIERTIQTTEFNGQKLLEGSSVSIQVGPDGSSTSTLEVGNVGLASAAQSLSSLDLSTQGGAQAAMQTLGEFSSTVTQSQGTIGAAQTRLNSISQNLASARETATAARARIMDADIAAEAANLFSGRILQQTSVAMLAQANQSAQNILRLFR